MQPRVITATAPAGTSLNTTKATWEPRGTSTAMTSVAVAGCGWSTVSGGRETGEEGRGVHAAKATECAQVSYYYRAITERSMIQHK